MSKVRNLPQTTSLDDADLLYAVDVSAGPNGGRKITKADLKTSVEQSPAEIKASYESNPDTNAFDDAEKAKLDGVEVGATADQSAAEVPYSNTGSGLAATNVQDAIDEALTEAQADFRPSIVSGRILHYSGGTARFDDVFFQLVAGDILLSPNITFGEVYVDLDGIVKQTGSGITAPPLSIVFAKFSTDLNDIISLTDERVKNTQNLVRGLLADIRDVRAGAAASAGSSGRLSDAMHKHNILTGAPSSQAPDQANAEGSSANLARADHIHDIPADAPTTNLSPASANAEGVGSSFARNDHTHALDMAQAGDLSTVNAGDAEILGTANRLIRADHQHPVATAAPSTQTPDQANAVGASVSLARADHIHAIPTATAVDVAGANAQGAAATFSRADHAHRGIRSLKANAGTQRFLDASLQDGLGTSVADDGSGNFTVDTKFGANEFVITSTSGLNINYSGGRFVNGQNGTISNVAAGTIAVSANTVLGYLYVAVSNLTNVGVVTAATTPPPLDSIPFAQFVSGPSTITSTTDIRSFVNLTPVANTLRVGYPGTGLTVSYNSGAVRINGTLTAVPAGILVLSNGVATGAIYVDPSTGLVTANGTGTFPPNCVPMATYTTAGGLVTALSLARAFIDNNVVFGASGDIAALTPDVAVAAGATNKFADAGHVHNVPADAPTTSLSSTTTNAEGVGSSFARNDHTHAILTGAPSTQTPDQANAAGSSANLAKADHIHQIVTAAPLTTLSPATTNAQGAATSFARSDHAHAVATSLVGDITTIQPDAAASAGTVDKYARGDHRHAIVADPAVSLSTSSTNTEGSSTSFARADHTHAVSITNSEATATADDTTTSATDVLMVSMTLTPAAGTYLVMWSGSIVNSANGAERTWVSLYSGGSQVSATERSIGTSGGGYSPSMTHAVVTVNGSQAIELRWRAAGGTSTVHSRRLSIARVG